MPHRTARRCSRCRRAVRGPSCPHCSRAYRERQGTRQANGYGADWEAKRLFILQRDTVCRLQTKCNGAPSVEVDHIVPFQGVDDPLRLDDDNLQGVCGPCHRHKSVTQDGGLGRRRVQHARA